MTTEPSRAPTLEPPAPDARPVDASIVDASIVDAAATGAGPDGAVPLPRGTSPTWELEMLLSGAVTVGLFQAPGQVHALLARAAGLGGAAVGGATAVLVAVLGAIYALIGAFVLHLATRAYWVGLVGLDSVFPQGIRWERLKTTGPITRAVYERRVPRLRPLIERLDNFAASIFSIAFLLVMMCALGALVSTGGFVLGLLVARAVGGDPKLFALGVAAAVFLASMLLAIAGLLDKRYGDRLPPDGGAARLVRALANASYTLLVGRLWSPILYTLITNVRLRVALPVVYVGLVAAYTAALVDLAVGEGIVRYERHAYFPAGLGASAVDPDRYDGGDAAGDAGDVGSSRLLSSIGGRPSIQSDVVTGPYVKLFVPYVPDRDDARLRAACPGLPTLQRVGVTAGPEGRGRVDTLAVRRVLDCFARVRPVSLNGRPLADPGYRFTARAAPGGGERGLVAYIATDSLPRGPNELAVGTRAADGTVGPAFVIPFWR